jgi:hypothetical protein
LLPVSLIPVTLLPVANLPPVSPVVHLDLRISPRIFEKNLDDPYVIFRGLGEGDLWKKTWSKKSRDTVPLIHVLVLTPEVYNNCTCILLRGDLSHLHRGFCSDWD